MRAILFIIFIITTRTVSQICNYENSVELTNGTFKGVKYEKGEFFFDNKTNVDRGCVCLKEICSRKCCPQGQIFNETILRCNNSPEEFNPPVWEGSKLKQDFNFTTEFHIFLSKMTCEEQESRIILGDITKDYHIKTDGKLYALLEDPSNKELVYGPDKYCVDNFFDSLESKMKLNALVCLMEEKQDNHYALSAICMFVSCFFIIITVATYSILPELRSTMHGKVMIAYLLSFFTGLLLLGTMLMLLLFGYISRSTCTIMTFFIYYSLLAGFFWLNVMTFDIYSKFNTMKITMRTDDRYRFIRYCIYAFGIPTALTIILIGLEYSGLPKNGTFLPDINRGTCFLNGTTRLIYLYTPILIVCVVNLILYVLIASKLTQIKKQTERLRKKDKQQAFVYIKLFIVAGTNWLLEVISSFYPDLDAYFAITDVYNLLVGLIIFIIFVCRKKILVSLQQRFKALSCVHCKKKQTPSVISTPVTTSTHSLENIDMSTVKMHEN